MACHILVLVLLVGFLLYIAGGCLNCFNECDENGECDEYGCLAGYHGNNCSLLCPLNCRDGVLKKPACDRDTAYCLSGCQQGFYGKRCDQHCPSKCANKTCAQRDGNCIHGCEAHWYGVNCTKECNVTCYNSTCDRSGLCYSCTTGFWGFFCENTCSKHCHNNACKMSEDGSFECSDGCQTGWRGAQCQEPILQDTRTRRGASDCYVPVVDGKCPCCKRNTGDMCNIDCPKCRTRYGNSKCDRFCEAGYYNVTKGLCDKPCGEHCSLDKDNKRSCKPSDGRCNSCENGYRGNHCQYRCNPNCVNKTCYINSGYCLKCSNVTYGYHCQKCSHGCLDMYCHRMNGTCMTGCTRGRYGYMCSDECPANCYKSNCSLSFHGSVMCTGCKAGFAGLSCEERCPVNCTVCNQLDAECLDAGTGCKSCPVNCTVCNQLGAECLDADWKRGLTAGDISAIVLGVVILLLLLAAAGYICYRKKLLCFKQSTVNKSVRYSEGISSVQESSSDNYGRRPDEETAPHQLPLIPEYPDEINDSADVSFSDERIQKAE